MPLGHMNVNMLENKHLYIKQNKINITPRGYNGIKYSSMLNEAKINYL